MIKGLRPMTSGLNRISKGMDELVQLPFVGTVKNYKIISFYAESDCTLIWNNEIELPIMAGAGLELDERFVPCESLILKENNVRYYFTIGY